MPPQQPSLTYSIRGYVCRSCLFKLKRKQYQSRPSWLVRNLTNDNGASKSKSRPPTTVPKLQTIPDPVIRYWEQTTDGGRREKGFEDQDLLASLESSIKKLEKDLGDTTHLEKRDAERDPIEEDEDDDVEGNIEAELSKESKLPRELLSQMEAIKTQLRRLEDDPYFLDNLSEEGKAKIRSELLDGLLDTNESSDQLLAPRDVSLSPKISEPVADPPRLMTATIPSIAFPDVAKRSILKFNSSLDFCSRYLAEDKLSDAAQQHAWGCYVRCRKYLLQVPEQVQLETWSLLWDIFENSNPNNFNRLEHIYRLGKDMRISDVPFQPKQRVLFIESIFIKGYEQRAITQWDEAKSSLGCNGPTFDEYWQLGIRMFSQHGDGENALDTAAFYLSNSDRIASFRMLIPVIRGYLVMGTERGNDRAWHAYEQLKSNLRSGMTMEDFDNVTTLFLDADLPDRALGVFKDMMLAGETARHGVIAPPLACDIHENYNLVEKVRAEFDLEKSRALATLPATFNNKFFFGKWIKKLIGIGHLDGAKKVLDLMGARGIRPDAKYVNGLIGALYRDGPLGKQQLAEEMAWQMITARLEFVKHREKAFSNLSKIFSLSESEDRPGTHHPIPIPLATIETFSILIQQYRRRQKQNLVPDLLRNMQEAKIPPSTFFMNQMILANVREHQGAWAWDTYFTLVNKQGVRPDFDTFTILWDLMRKASSQVAKFSQGGSFTSCRELFFEMMKRSEILREKEGMPQEVYDMTILGFSLAQDIPGTAVALHALQQHFHMYPTESTVRTIVLQLARLGNRDSEGRIQKHLTLSKKSTQIRIHEVTKVLATFKKRRMDALMEQGIVYQELEDGAKSEQSLIILTDLLHFVNQVHSGNDESASRNSREAAAMMGVQDCDPWNTIISE